MLNNKVKVSQLTLMLLLIIPGGKYLSLPALLASELGRDSWVAYALLFLADFICLLAILRVYKLNKRGESFYEILSKTLTTVVAKIIFVLFAVLYSLRITLLCFNTMDMFSSTFSIDTNWLAYVIPICAIIIFALFKGPTTIARVIQITFVPIILSLLVILCFSAAQADFSNLMPILDRGIGIVAKICPKHTFWFADSIVLLFFMDHLQPQQNPDKREKTYPIIISFWIGAIICVALNIVFIGLFDQLAEFNDLAMSKVSQFFIQVTANGRLDWLTLAIWLISVFIKMIIFAYCAYRSWKFVFSANQVKFSWVYTALTLLPVIVLPLVVYTEKFIVKINRSIAGQIVLFILQYALTLILPLLCFFSNLKNRKGNKMKYKGYAVGNNSYVKAVQNSAQTDENKEPLENHENTENEFLPEFYEQNSENLEKTPKTEEEIPNKKILSKVLTPVNHHERI